MRLFRQSGARLNMRLATASCGNGPHTLCIDIKSTVRSGVQQM